MSDCDTTIEGSVYFPERINCFLDNGESIIGCARTQDINGFIPINSVPANVQNGDDILLCVGGSFSVNGKMICPSSVQGVINDGVTI